MTRYYLNNTTDAVISIKLTADRTIPAKTSLPLNNKDVEIFKKLVAARKGKLGALEGIKLSTIRIEDDSRYTKKDAEVAKADAAKVEDELKKQAEELEKEEAARKELEEKAKAEAEAAAKAALENAGKEETEGDEETEETEGDEEETEVTEEDAAKAQLEALANANKEPEQFI